MDSGIPADDQAATADGGSAGASSPAQPDDTTNATVTDVVDGDTIRAMFHGRETTVRLIGLDAPEVAGPYTSMECFGPRASEFTTRVLDGQPVRLELDVEEQDRFGRTLAYVWLGDRFFNEELVRGGFATVAIFLPNVSYVDRLRSAEQDARAHDRGLWGECGPELFELQD